MISFLIFVIGLLYGIVNYFLFMCWRLVFRLRLRWLLEMVLIFRVVFVKIMGECVNVFVIFVLIWSFFVIVVIVFNCIRVLFEKKFIVYIELKLIVFVCLVVLILFCGDLFVSSRLSFMGIFFGGGWFYCSVMVRCVLEGEGDWVFCIVFVWFLNVW